MFLEFVAVLDDVVSYVILHAIATKRVGICELIINLSFNSFNCPVRVMDVFFVFPNQKVERPEGRRLHSGTPFQFTTQNFTIR